MSKRCGPKTVTDGAPDRASSARTDIRNYPFLVTFRTDDGVTREHVLYAPGQAWMRKTVARYFDSEGIIVMPGSDVRVRWLPFSVRDDVHGGSKLRQQTGSALYGRDPNRIPRELQGIRLEQTLEQRRPRRREVHSWIFDQHDRRWKYEQASSNAAAAWADLESRLAYEYQHLPPSERVRFAAVTRTRRPPQFSPVSPIARDPARHRGVFRQPSRTEPIRTSRLRVRYFDRRR